MQRIRDAIADGFRPWAGGHVGRRAMLRLHTVARQEEPDRDAADIAAFYAGDQGALDQLVRRHKGLIRAVISGQLSGFRRHIDLETAIDDAEQLTWIKVAQTSARFDPSLSKFSTWISLIARREAISHLRWLLDEPLRPPETNRPGSDSSTDDELERLPDPGPTVERRVDTSKFERNVNACVEAILNVLDRAALDLENQGWTLAETAVALEYRDHNFAARHLSAAKKQVADGMKQCGWGPEHRAAISPGDWQLHRVPALQSNVQETSGLEAQVRHSATLKAAQEFVEKLDLHERCLVDLKARGWDVGEQSFLAVQPWRHKDFLEFVHWTSGGARLYGPCAAPVVARAILFPLREKSDAEIPPGVLSLVRDLRAQTVEICRQITEIEERFARRIDEIDSEGDSDVQS